MPYIARCTKNPFCLSSLQFENLTLFTPVAHLYYMSSLTEPLDAVIDDNGILVDAEELKKATFDYRTAPE